MFFVKEFSLLRKLLKADNQDVSHDRRQQLYYHFAMKLFVSLRFLKGCPNARRMRQLHTLILRRLIANMPAALYQHALALVAIGQCAAALIPLNTAITLEHLPSRALLAQMMIQGREGIAEDRNRVFELVKDGACLGCHHCQGVMAECYMRGYGGCAIDGARSLELAHKSSAKGSKYGQYILSRYHFPGLGGVAQDYTESLSLLRLAAAQNFDEAQKMLGWMYANGRGVDRDNTEALRLYQLAAAQGNPEALYYVGFFYQHGRGVPANKAEASLWYRRALAAGYIYAKHALEILGV